MQHSCSFSPFLDFTFEKEIALIFATHKENGINAYNNTDAAVYLLCSKNEETHNANYNFGNVDICFYKRKIKIDDSIFGKILYDCNVEDFKFSYDIFTNETNDRMKYQKGLFICFKKTVIVNNQLLHDSSENLIFKAIIKKETKREIYYKITSSKKYSDYDYLMNPYKYFEKDEID